MASPLAKVIRVLATGVAGGFLSPNDLQWSIALMEEHIVSNTTLITTHGDRHNATGDDPIPGELQDPQNAGKLRGETLTLTAPANGNILRRSGGIWVNTNDVAGLTGLLASSQTPLGHNSTHENGGSDPIPSLPSSDQKAALDNATTPNGANPYMTAADMAAGSGAHAATHQNGGADEISVAGLSGVLADPQDPQTHGSRHEALGSDPIPSIPTVSEKAAMSNASSPSNINPFVTNNDVSPLLPDFDQKGAMDSAQLPNSSNPFITQSALSGLFSFDPSSARVEIPNQVIDYTGTEGVGTPVVYDSILKHYRKPTTVSERSVGLIEVLSTTIGITGASYTFDAANNTVTIPNTTLDPNDINVGSALKFTSGTMGGDQDTVFVIQGMYDDGSLTLYYLESNLTANGSITTDLTAIVNDGVVVTYGLMQIVATTTVVVPSTSIQNINLDGSISLIAIPKSVNPMVPGANRVVVIAGGTNNDGDWIYGGADTNSSTTLNYIVVDPYEQKVDYTGTSTYDHADTPLNTGWQVIPAGSSTVLTVLSPGNFDQPHGQSTGLVTSRIFPGDTGTAGTVSVEDRADPNSNYTNMTPGDSVVDTYIDLTDSSGYSITKGRWRAGYQVDNSYFFVTMEDIGIEVVSGTAIDLTNYIGCELFVLDCDTSGSAVTATLKSGREGDRVLIKDTGTNAATNNITINTDGVDNFENVGAPGPVGGTSYVISTNGASAELMFLNGLWRIV